MSYLNGIKKLRRAAYDELRKERLEFEEFMSKRLSGNKRTFLEEVLGNERAPSEVSFTSKEVKKLVSDVAFVCFRINESEMSCAWSELMKCLRHSRYAVIQAPCKWSIYANQEESLKTLLAKQGFIISANGVGQPTIKIGKTLHKASVLKSKDEVGLKKAESKPKLLRIELNATVEELLDELGDSKTGQIRKKMIRAKLRRMGHIGGLRGVQ